jgi:F-type H+-transporting ATPase subunit b
VYLSQLPQEGGGGGGLATLGFDLPSLIVYLVNFVILLVILYLAAYKPFLRMMDERSARIKEGLEAAERAKEESARAQGEMQARLAEARKEGQQLLERAREMAERFKQDEREKARAEAEAFIAQARTDIQQERDEAIAQVRRQFADLAIRAAEQVINRSLDAQAHQDIIEGILEENSDMRGA